MLLKPRFDFSTDFGGAELFSVNVTVSLVTVSLVTFAVLVLGADDFFVPAFPIVSIFRQLMC